MTSAVLTPPTMDFATPCVTPHFELAEPLFGPCATHEFKVAFSCRSCGAQHMVPRQREGQPARCGECNARMRVPSAERPALEPISQKAKTALRLSVSMIMATAVWGALFALLLWGFRDGATFADRDLACMIAAPLTLLLYGADRLRKPGPAWAKFIPAAPLLILAPLAAFLLA